MTPPQIRRLAYAALSVVAIAIASACTDGPVSPQDDHAVRLNLLPGVPGGTVTLCKQGAPGTFTTSLEQGGTGTLAFTSPFTVAAGQCVVVWTGRTAGATDPCCEPLDQVNIVETSAVPTQIQLTSGNCNVASLTATGISVEVNTFITCVVTFYNPPPPPPPGAGCTPGFWKNSVGSWPPTGYSPSQSFNSVFGVVAFTPDITLFTAVGLGKGDKNALARHAVAALLSASHPDVDYGMTAAQVIAAVQGAVASGNYESVKNDLAALNELGCSLANDNSF